MRSLIKYVLKHHWKILLIIIILTYIEIYFDVSVLVFLSLVFKAITAHKIDIAYSILPDIYNFIAISIITSILLTSCNIYLMSRFTYNLRAKTFDIISNSDKIEEYGKIKHIAVFSRIVANVSVEQDFLMFLFKKILFIFVFAIFLINEIIPYNVEILSLLILSSFVISLFLLIGLKRVSKCFFKVRKHQLYQNSLFSDTVKKFRVVRYFSNEAYENKQYNDEVQITHDMDIQFFNRLKFSLIAAILVDLSFCALVYLLIILFKNGELDVFMVLVIVQVMVLLMANMDTIFKLTSTYSPVHVRNVEVDQILSLDKEKADNDKLTIEGNVEKIEFRDVSLKLDEKEILNNISFKIDCNTKTLIMGDVASGKTSLAYLLTKFHDATAGEILINGNNIDNISTVDLREKITIVPTESYLFTDTLLENIRLGDESITNNEILDVCKETLLNEYDIDLNEKLYEKESGVNGDFKQRLALTRALLHESDVYIFDNSFSLINTESKTVILKNIEEKLKDKTIIFLENCYEYTYDVDNIIILDNTGIIDHGNNKNLLENYDFEKNSSISKGRCK